MQTPYGYTHKTAIVPPEGELPWRAQLLTPDGSGAVIEEYYAASRAEAQGWLAKYLTYSSDGAR